MGNDKKIQLSPEAGSFIRSAPSNPDASVGNSGEAPVSPPAEGGDPSTIPDMQDVELVDGTYRGRMDFVMEKVQADDETRIIRTLLVPDPRRYDVVDRDGEKFYLDKFLRVLISFEDMRTGMMGQMVGRPIYHLSPSIDSTPKYAAARLDAVRSELQTGEHQAPIEKAIKHTDFYANASARPIAFLSVDICGGTAQRRANPAHFERAYKIFLQELGTVVGQFNGAILKPTGDGFIALIDYPGFTTQCDNTIDLGLSLLVVLRDSVNPALKEAGLPELKIRVGADFGQAAIRSIEIPATGFAFPEVASDALNRAVKIQESCAANEFRIGRALYELVHVQWLMRSKKVDFDSNDIGAANYPVYRVT